MSPHPGIWTCLIPLDDVMADWDDGEDLLPVETTPSVAYLIVGMRQQGVWVGFADNIRWAKKATEHIDDEEESKETDH